MIHASRSVLVCSRFGTADCGGCVVERGETTPPGRGVPHTVCRFAGVLVGPWLLSRRHGRGPILEVWWR